GTHGFDPGGAVVFKVLHGEEPSHRVRIRDDLAGDSTLVKRIAPAAGNLAIRSSQARILEYFTYARSTAFGQKRACKICVDALFPRFDGFEVACNRLRDWSAILGVSNGRLQELSEAHRSKTGSQLVPAVDTSRHGPAQGT